jgi:hypothetical protein
MMTIVMRQEAEAMFTCIVTTAASAHVKISGGAAGSKDER